MNAPGPFAPPLLLITDRRRFPEPADPGEFHPAERAALEAALAAGVGAIQLREKDLAGGVLARRARALRAMAVGSGARVLVNDRVDVAAAVAVGVHLPGQGLPSAAARELLGSGALVGRSVHSVDEVGQQAVEEAVDEAGLDYVLFGPVYDTPSKRPFGPPQGLGRLAAVVAASRVPVLAVGGVTPGRVREILDAGGAGVAVIGAVLGAIDPGAAVRELCAALAARG